MPAALAQGTTIERYRIEAVIGAGSMGDVFRGIDIDLKRKVAIKILADKHRDNNELRARFVREARAVAAISHSNVVQVFTTGSFDDRPYIAMEFLDGTDLGTLVQENGPCPSLQAARAVSDAALGLEAAAKAGLIHRDVKPSNLVLLHDGHVKVTDFGLAKPLDPGDEPALTAMGVVVGTPDYIAPEQARGDALDERVDIYALGGTLYFLLTGVPPFRTGNPVEDKYLKVVARHLKKPAPSARSRKRDVDNELSDLARTMMAKKPAERPGYDELLERLAAITDRLEETSGQKRDSKPSRRGASRGKGVSARVASPTPYVGGNQPNAFPDPDHPEDPEEAVPTNVRIPSGPVQSVAPHGAPQGSPHGSPHDSIDGYPPVDSPFDSPFDSIDGHTPPPGVATYTGDTADGVAPTFTDEPVAAPRASRVLIALTVLAVLVFLTGLGLTIFGPMPEAQVVAPPSTAPDASVPEPQSTMPPDAGAAESAFTVPDGMFLVRKRNGAPWFYAARKPVTHGEYAELFPNQKKSRKRLNERPVTGVSYRYAQAYAEARDRRLITGTEWTAAAKASEFSPAGKLWEWAAPHMPPDDADGAARTRSVYSSKGSARRPSRGAKDITFRLAADLDAGFAAPPEN